MVIKNVLSSSICSMTDDALVVLDRLSKLERQGSSVISVSYLAVQR